ncbi:hypothetical protein B0A49_11217 [Cryomyces minteri]|uniref:Pre-mRNA-splicing factor n=2 Tax=Cryomyces TaxID=329878 RepID=A0A4U0WHG6_9PEZI|nr:hypothetical protein B0A49_11217 [Cryomyces minteri]
MASATMAPSEDAAILGRPTVADLKGDSHYAQIARKHWLTSVTPPKVKPNIVKQELWDHLEKEGFAFRSLLLLEQLQLVERYLWPGYTEESSNYHVLLLALMVIVKKREGLPAWEHLSSRPAEFSSFFRRILSMSIDYTFSSAIRMHLVSFIIGAFQSMDSGLVRRECAPLVSIGIWDNLHSEAAREAKLEKNSMLKKAWRGAVKRFEAADESTKGRLRFERSWLFTLSIDFLDRIYDTTTSAAEDNIRYCERFVEFLTDLQSQPPTRRYVNSLIRDLNLLPAMRLSLAFNDEENGLFRELYNLLRHYVYFPIDDQTGQQLSPAQYHQEHCTALARLQRVALKHFRDKLALLVLSNLGSLEQRAELGGHLESLTVPELVELCTVLGFRTEYPTSSFVAQTRSFFVELLLSAHERKPTYQETLRDLSILPTESTLYETTFLRNETYNGSRPLAIPKLNLMYLTMGDFLWRSFILSRCESFYEIRKDMEDTIKRLQPRSAGSVTKFEGFSKMALPITKPAIVEVLPPRVAELSPAEVRAEVILDVSRLSPGIRREWESLRPGDIVFLLSVQAVDENKDVGNGISVQDVANRQGLKHLRSAEVIKMMDENGRSLREMPLDHGDKLTHRPRQRRLIVKLDTVAYKEDKERADKGKPDTYEAINVIVRRKGRENNFKPILDSIKQLTLSRISAPGWFRDVFLGIGDPAGASYKRLTNQLKSIDFRDTFLDWQHLIESLPGRTVEPNEAINSSYGPPYVLETSTEEAQPATTRGSKKRRRDQTEISQQASVDHVKVSTYKPLNTGPYPADVPKSNTVRFTPAQIEAINSGTQPGLTVILGPPGTGKTDVATQIINNIYHNFPTQRTLLVAHSNQALNQLFQKITALDIDERHLLRLGHGEEELETESSYSKHGRVESFLEIGARYMAEVTRLAASINAPGDHGSSCETADYFNLVYIEPAWKKYIDRVQSNECTAEEAIEIFPFHQYFATAPQPLFSPDAPRDEIVETALGCYRHIEKLFSELEDIRPFEILRSGRDKANYLLIKEARIIAMTSTHAGMRRQEIANLGFHYDNVVMEEAAQITEIESFVPLALQNPDKDGELPLQRVVLCGDHLQNSPIIQNLAFRQYANLEQSLFLRLVRLGVPTVLLDRQGRARPSLAALYKWRYPSLGDLPLVSTSREFLSANAGFRYDYQFIDVPDYKGHGEMEPTPHFIQNLGEAEYAVAIYMYMRLLGYSAEKISILCTYAGQRALVMDVLGHRCRGNRLFGMPGKVSTVDRYQGEQNDYIILSLTRTTRPGYLRDIRRLTVALSRARLGLYVLGRREVFEPSYELRDAFELLLQRPAKLMLTTGEIHPTDRKVEDDVPETEMDGVEHLGQYVFEMTKAKVEALKAGGGVLPPAPEERLDEDEDMADAELGSDDEMQGGEPIAGEGPEEME